MAVSVKGQFSNNNELYNFALKRYIELTNFKDSTMLVEGYTGMQYIIDSLPNKINEKEIKYISAKGIKKLLKTNEFISLVSIRPMVISGDILKIDMYYISASLKKGKVNFSYGQGVTFEIKFDSNNSLFVIYKEYKWGI